MPKAEQLEAALRRHVLDAWFPRCLDHDYGGFLCDFDRAWRSSGPHEKLLEFQARQTWIASLGSLAYPGDARLREASEHGLRYLREVMWDPEHGGWFHRLDRAGRPLEQHTKHTHGSAYAIAACAVAGDALGDPAALELASTGLDWIRQHAYDRRHGGYWGFLDRDGTVIREASAWPSLTDTIDTPIGQKDANVHSDLIETLTAFYARRPSAAALEWLAELVEIVGERMTSPDGLLSHYCLADWTRLPCTHFGCQLQTAHRFATAAPLLRGELVAKARRLLDRALELGWDDRAGGLVFADAGPGRAAKAWWPQVEGLRALVTAGDPAYAQQSEELWRYIEHRLLDERYGGVYSHGLDRLPPRYRLDGRRRAAAWARAKGSVWKDGWHDGAAFLVCMTAGEDGA